MIDNVDQLLELDNIYANKCIRWGITGEVSSTIKMIQQEEEELANLLLYPVGLRAVGCGYPNFCSYDITATDRGGTSAQHKVYVSVTAISTDMLYFDTTYSGATFAYSVPSLTYDVSNVAAKSSYWAYELDKYKFIIPLYKSALDDNEL